MKLYRITKKKYAGRALDGEGSFLFGGRWSSRGTRVAYTSQHQSLAMLEHLAHFDAEDMPDDLVVAVIDVPEGVSERRVEMPAGKQAWRNPVAPPELALIGDQFVRDAAAALLWVPSALVPREWNCLVNPAHEDALRLRVESVEPLECDPRLLK